MWYNVRRKNQRKEGVDMLISRTAEGFLDKTAQEMPVVTVYGPRQSGKTTLVRHVFKDFAYANLENPTVRELAVHDPEAFFRQYPAPAIIDEVQRVPDLLSYIQMKVDESGKCGQYILTGSHQPILRAKVSQSLAGRTSILTLLPLSLVELSESGKELSMEQAIVKGFLPRVHASRISATDIYEDYYRTYVERDVRQLVEVENQTAFETFIRLLAGRVGQVVNFESLAGGVGVSAPTLRKWLSVLEASYVVFRLHPYYENFGKRLVKSPKVYFTDVGLAAHLLRIRKEDQVLRDPLVGGLFENLVVSEALKWKYNAHHIEDFYFFRDNNGLEVDLVMEQARRLHLMEIKSSMTPDRSQAKNLRRLGAVAPVLSSTVVYRGEDFPIADGGEFVNFSRLSSRLDKLAGIK